jgi:integrase
MATTTTDRPNGKPRRPKRANNEGSVRRRGRTWYLRISRDGTQRDIKTSATTRTEALAALRARLQEIADNRSDPSAEQTRVRDLYEDMRRDYVINNRGVAALERRWRLHLAPAFGTDNAASITVPRLRHYVENRLADRAQPATVQRELAALRRMFRLGLEAGKVLRVPVFPTIRVDNIRTGFFERDEFERVRAELPAYLQPAVTLAYWTGWRRGELLNLEWRHVDLDAGTVRLDPGTTKNKEGRFVYLPAEALDALRAWRRRTAEVERERSCIIGHVFHHDDRPIRDFSVAWRGACARAGVAGRTLHDFRRTAARNYVRAGVPERVAMQILGHKTRAIFDRYNIVSEGDLRAAAEKVAAPVRDGLGKILVLPTGQTAEDTV